MDTLLFIVFAIAAFIVGFAFIYTCITLYRDYRLMRRDQMPRARGRISR